MQGAPYAILPLPVFMESTHGMGEVHAGDPDVDGIIRIPKRKAFVEGPDLAYVYNVYSIVDKAGKEIEGGNFVQVWKLRKGRWLIAADVFVASPKAN